MKRFVLVYNRFPDKSVNNLYTVSVLYQTYVGFKIPTRTTRKNC